MEKGDKELFADWRAGDERAGNALFERHFDSLYRFFRNKVPDGAEDLVQQTFLSCVTQGDNFRGDSSFRSYLFLIARSRLYDFLRTRQRKQDPLDFMQVSIADMKISPSSVIAQRDEEQLLARALNMLPLELQLAVELFYYEDMPATEVARILEIPEGTVRSRVRRALAQLREHVRALGSQPDLIEATLSNIEHLSRV